MGHTQVDKEKESILTSSFGGTYQQQLQKGVQEFPQPVVW